MASILGDLGGVTIDFGQNPASTSPKSSTTARPPVLKDYGWVIPVVVGVVCLVVISLCIAWFALYNKKRTKRYRLQTCNTHQREQSFDDWARNSTRSAEREKSRERENTRSRTPMCHTICRAPDYRPSLGMIRESPEDRLADLKSKGHVIHAEEQLFSPEDSVIYRNANISMSMGGHMPGHMPYYPSPGHYPSPGNYPNSSHSHPNLVLPAQAPFSPYRLTWISPSPMDPRVIRSEPNIVESSVSRCPSNSISSSTCGTSLYPSNMCIKSPYNPNPNTPCSSDGDSTGKEGLPPNTIINQSWANNSNRGMDTTTSSGQTSPVKGGVERGGERDARVNMSNRGQQTANDIPCCNNSRCGMVMWSYVAPPCPMDTSHIPPPPYARVMHQDRILRNISCEQCQACATSTNSSSMVPDIGSSSASVCNNQCYGNTSGPYPYSNTSICGNMDSMEMTHYSSITGAHSYNASGYHAGPSHSTSIAGHMTSRDESLSSGSKSAAAEPATEERGTQCGSTSSVVPNDTTASETTTSGTSQTTTNSSQQLSVTHYSTRSAPAAIGNNSTWADSNGDSLTMEGSTPHDHLLAHQNMMSLQPIQLPQVVESSMMHSMASASLPSSRYTPEHHVCHMAIDVPLDQQGTPDADWDTFPYYTPLSVASANSRQTTPDSVNEFGPHLHLMYSTQPVLRDAQYWV